MKQLIGLNLSHDQQLLAVASLSPRGIMPHTNEPQHMKQLIGLNLSHDQQLLAVASLSPSDQCL